MEDTHVAVIGAGPHGLAAAAHLGRAGVECRVLGEPMSFWSTMPAGMLLRSNATATGIAEHDGPLSLDGYRARTGRVVPVPVPLEDFIDYGHWVQRRVTPDVDRRRVDGLQHSGDGFLLRLHDGTAVRARRVVVATGIADFVHLPVVARGLPSELVSHTSEHRDLSVLGGRSVLVVGLGQSALESAALLHEHDADVEVVGRRDHINWLHGGKYHRRLGPAAPLFYAPTDVGPLGLSRVVAAPNFFRRLPRSVQDPLAYRAIRPAAAAWLGPRLEGLSITLGRHVVSLRPAGDRVTVELDDGATRTVDHVMFGTGYRVDVTRYPFLDDALADGIATARGYPLLRPGMESSVPGLHFLGAPAAWSFGPTMRFVAGGWFGGASLARAILGDAAPGRRSASLSGAR
jgi:cation diffusion facilitator CzcD-associated flavoprotein CzcO